MAKGKLAIRAEEIRVIKVMADAGNDFQMIAGVLKIPKSQVRYVLSHLYKFQEELKPLVTTTQEQNELIGDFERIMRDKKSSAIIGKELMGHMSIRHRDYRKSWDADSFCKFKFKSGKYVGIVATSDFHIGHEGVDYDQLVSDIQLIANTDNMYTVFLGDPMDNFINGDKHLGAIITAVTSPKDQLYMFKYLLSLLKNPSQKLLFVTKDNHVSARLKKATGIDYTNKMWSDLNIFYGGEEIRCEMTIGDITYNLLARHKYRGGSAIHLTASAKKLLRDGKYGDVDIVMLAHRHEGATELFHYRGQPRLAVQTSTYKLFDPYAASLGYDSPNIFMPTIILAPDQKEFILVPNVATAAKFLKKLNK